MLKFFKKALYCNSLETITLNEEERMKILLKVILLVILLGVVGTIHRSLDSTTWLAESRIAADQVEDSNAPVVALQATDEGRKTMNGVFIGLYVIIAFGFAVNIKKQLEKQTEKKGKEENEEN